MFWCTCWWEWHEEVCVWQEEAPCQSACGFQKMVAVIEEAAVIATEEEEEEEEEEDEGEA